jgi:hypothetical protein
MCSHTTRYKWNHHKASLLPCAVGTASLAILFWCELLSNPLSEILFASLSSSVPSHYTSIYLSWFEPRSGNVQNMTAVFCLQTDAPLSLTSATNDHSHASLCAPFVLSNLHKKVCGKAMSHRSHISNYLSSKIPRRRRAIFYYGSEVNGMQWKISKTLWITIIIAVVKFAGLG